MDTFINTKLAPVQVNVYCDESCHLENDNQKSMVIGAVYCEKKYAKQIHKDIRGIIKKNNYNEYSELKWTKISNTNSKLYKEIINYFFNSKKLNARFIIADKQELQHNIFEQSHTDFYYKLYYLLLKEVLKEDHVYKVYIDIMDKYSGERTKHLTKVLKNNSPELKFDREAIQPVKSDEVILIQLADILAGAISFFNRYNNDFENRSKAKTEISCGINSYIYTKYNKQITETNYLKKFNIFVWRGKYV